MKQEITYLSMDEKTTVHAYIWEPQGQVKAVVQVIHGMLEFVERYKNFAEYLNYHGIVFAGNDLLGHGASVVSEDEYGYFSETNGNRNLLGDIHELHVKLHEKYPDVPYFILGHSMGSFLARQYITLYGSTLSGAIISGTGSQAQMTLNVGKKVCRSAAGKHGWHYRSEKISSMAMGSYNKGFEPARTPADWLTRDERVVDRYLADPRCTFTFTVNGFYEMFKSIERCQEKAAMKRIPKELPILLIAGEKDPVGNCGKAVRKVYQDYQKLGIRDAELKLYPECRHELLNELNREEVYADLLAWIEKRI